MSETPIQPGGVAEPTAHRPNGVPPPDLLSPGAAGGARADAILWLTPEELGALAAAAGPELLRRAGAIAGRRGWERFVPRAEEEFGTGLAEVSFGRVVQTWWWPFRAGGWGRCRINLGYRSLGVMLVEVENPPWDADAPGFCDFLAGVFAATFGSLAGRELAGMPLPGGPGRSVVLIATRKILRAAESVAAEFAPATLEDLIGRLPRREPPP